MGRNVDRRIRRLRTTLDSLFLVLSLVLAAACASTSASSAKREPLAVPPPPPRVLAPTTEIAEQPIAPVEEPVPPLPRVARPPRESRSEAKPTGGTTETSGAGPTTPAGTPAAPAPATGSTAPGAPELRTVQTPDDGKGTRQVRETIDRAQATLGRVDYGRLPKASQLQYDMAKRFIEQAEEALKTRNYTAAQLMAEKADTIARELATR